MEIAEDCLLNGLDITVDLDENSEKKQSLLIEHMK